MFESDENSTIEEHAHAKAGRDFDLSRGDVPTFVTLPPKVKVDIDRTATALADNPYFACLGHEHRSYVSRSKRTGERMVCRDFSDELILALAPRAFWKTWSGREGFPRLMIKDSLIQLSLGTGKFRLATSKRSALDD